MFKERTDFRELKRIWYHSKEALVADKKEKKTWKRRKRLRKRRKRLRKEGWTKSGRKRWKNTKNIEALYERLKSDYKCDLKIVRLLNTTVFRWNYIVFGKTNLKFDFSILNCGFQGPEVPYPSWSLQQAFYQKMPSSKSIICTRWRCSKKLTFVYYHPPHCSVFTVHY